MQTAVIHAIGDSAVPFRFPRQLRWLLSFRRNFIRHDKGSKLLVPFRIVSKRKPLSESTKESKQPSDWDDREGCERTKGSSSLNPFSTYRVWVWVQEFECRSNETKQTKWTEKTESTEQTEDAHVRVVSEDDVAEEQGQRNTKQEILVASMSGRGKCLTLSRWFYNQEHIAQLRSSTDRGALQSTMWLRLKDDKQGRKDQPCRFGTFRPDWGSYGCRPSTSPANVVRWCVPMVWNNTISTSHERC